MTGAYRKSAYFTKKVTKQIATIIDLSLAAVHRYEDFLGHDEGAAHRGWCR